MDPPPAVSGFFDFFVARGEAAIDRCKREGGGLSVDEAMADLQGRLDAARSQAAKRSHQ